MVPLFTSLMFNHLVVRIDHAIYLVLPPFITTKRSKSKLISQATTDIIEYLFDKHLNLHILYPTTYVYQYIEWDLF